MNAIESLYGFEQMAGGSSGKPAQELGKEDFLNLLVAQLRNQDPLNPSDPTEFTAQLAQFTSVEQLYNINDNLKAVDALSGEFGRMSALSLIDRSVVVNDNAFRMEGDGANLGFDFADPVESVTLYIRTEDGQSVAQLAVPGSVSGEQWAEWDGTDANGMPLPSGNYTFSAVGKTGQGDEVQGRSLVESRITGADFSDSTEKLLTDNGDIRINDITRVK